MEIRLHTHAVLVGPPAPLAEALKRDLTLLNPKWQENQRLGRWNKGVEQHLRYYSEEGTCLTLPRGSMRRVITRCRECGVAFEIKDERRRFDEVGFGFEGELRPFQEEAVSQMMKKEFGVLTAPTGAGKTVMALALVARRAQPTLIVVHTRDLASQWVSRIHSFLGVEEKEVGFIGGGTFRMGEKITVAMVQSLYKRAEEVAPRVGHLVVDECHRAPSRTFTEAVTCFDAAFMTGLSATPWRRDRLSKVIFMHLGEPAHSVDKAPLVDAGHILKAEVRFRPTPFFSEIDATTHYAKLMTQLTGDAPRNHLIAKDIAEELPLTEGVLLVLSDRKAHCEKMRSLLRYNHGIEADLITGDLSKAQRAEVLSRLDRGETKVLFATSQLLGEGFDAPSLSTLFLTYPIRFSGRLLQYLGRVLRPGQGKEAARIVDYVDAQVGVLESAARSRLGVYRRNGVGLASGGEEDPWDT